MITIHTFKAWDYTTNKMGYVFGIDWETKTIKMKFYQIVKATVVSQIAIRKFDEVDILVFTNAYDKTKWKELSKNERMIYKSLGMSPKTWKGKWIYHKDIIKFKAYSASGHEFEHKEIISSEPPYGFYPLNKDDARDNYTLKKIFIYQDDVENCKVIGNVFENPELLGENNDK